MTAWLIGIAIGAGGWLAMVAFAHGLAAAERRARSAARNGRAFRP